MVFTQRFDQSLTTVVCNLMTPPFLNFLPSRCIFCLHPDDNNHGICTVCEHHLPRNLPACEYCAQAITETEFATFGRCQNCRVHVPQFYIFAPYRYTAPLDFALQQYKYHGKSIWGYMLAQLFTRQVMQTSKTCSVPALQSPVDAILPLPLHRRRQTQRGFNQSGFFAQILGATLQLPVLTKTMVRLRNTTSQSGLNFHARKRNIVGAFALHMPVAGKHIVIIDDVITSSASVRVAAHALLAAGAQKVSVWALLRTMKQN